MLIGYIRVSKSDGTQTLEPQRDALFAAGIDPSRIYEDMGSVANSDTVSKIGLMYCQGQLR